MRARQGSRVSPAGFVAVQVFVVGLRRPARIFAHR
jgi:hypothetical protein